LKKEKSMIRIKKVKEKKNKIISTIMKRSVK